MFKVITDPLAEKDIDEIFEWYEGKRFYLGFEFLSELEQCIFSLQNNPFAYFNVTGRVRRIPIARFPYNVYYSIKSNTVYVHVIMHQHKNPEEWQRRLN